MTTTRILPLAPSTASGAHRLPIGARDVFARIATTRILPSAHVRAGRSHAIAAIVAHAGEGLPMRVLSLVADAGLVLFAIDDLFDDSDLSVEEKSMRVEQYTAVARGERRPELAAEPIAVAVATLRRRIAAADRDGALVDAWAQAMGNMLAGMAAELPGGYGPCRPSLARYLEGARDTAGVEMIALTAWIATDALATREMLPALRRAERCFATAVRLANDLRTCERERAEGRVNAVTLVGEEFRPLLRELYERALADGHDVLAHAGVAGTAQGLFVARFADAVVSLYRTRDFEQAA